MQILKSSGYWRILFLSGIIILMVHACKDPDPVSDLDPIQKDMYISNRDASVNFADFKTYFLIDSLKMIGKDTIIIPKHYLTEELIIHAIDSNLQNLGFARVNLDQHPDVAVVASVLRFKESVPLSYSPTLFGPGVFGYASSSEFGFPGYQFSAPDNFGFYSFDVGSLAIDMIDLKNAPSAGKLNIIWNGLLLGAANDSLVANPQRVLTGINVLFEQSPYLKDGK
ncbi:MAG: DUF4136 domain-containing protein [Sporocytophaga sp.]|uniref:DUF4136 domain-containing protein n=1 Tax=Sporocytophaga sp. TaxID=2231183 RepID=UPI001B0B1DCD|nr:DUF4136 domain-containing protein [Sporocytophaga sp.]MBO9702627.1 DUF4136 domain-containing protein [Sporocytophaga sp.]